MVALRKYGPPVPAEVRASLGKRANTVSAHRGDIGHKDRRGAGRKHRDTPDYLAETKARRGAVKLVTTEKDQPRHVRERVARALRWMMQDKAAELAGWRLDRQNRRRKDRVSDCLRKVSDVASGVECRYNPATKSGHYRGLQTCGSVWHCPICAAKISNHRRRQLARLVTAHLATGGSVWMTTYTVSHKKYTSLEQLLDDFLAARRKMRQGRRGMGLRSCFGVVGTVSVLEVTWSPRHGWHPHVHELVFSDQADMNPDAYDQAARAAWKDAAAAFGLRMNAHGFKIDRTYGAVQDYIAKFGHEPEQKLPWGVESEMVKGHIKQARGEDGATPFALLRAATDGLAWAEPLWQEYCQQFKGKKQLNFSPGLKKLYGIDDDEDQEIAEGEAGEAGDPVTLVEISPAQWDQVVEARTRGGLYELMQQGRPGVLIAGLAEIGVQVEPVDMTGWKVSGPDGPGEVDRVWADVSAPGGWQIRVYLDDRGGDRWRVYALWDVEVLGDGAQERAALLAEVDAALHQPASPAPVVRAAVPTATMTQDELL